MKMHHRLVFRLCFMLVVCTMAFHVQASNNKKECDFAYLGEEVPIFAKYTEEITSKARSDGNLWGVLEASLPNLKRAYASQSPYFFVGLGWNPTEEVLDRFSRKQVEIFLRKAADRSAINASRQGHVINVHFRDDGPITMYTTREYKDGGYDYRDLGMDVVATESCIVSLKISGRLLDLGDEYWIEFRNQMELMRKAVADEYGVVAYSEKGSRFSKRQIMEISIWLSVMMVCAWIASIIYQRYFDVFVSRAARGYSLTMMILSVVMVAVTIWANETIGVGTVVVEYQTVPHFLLLFMIHLWSYLSRAPKVFSLGIAMVVVALISSITLWGLGWVAVTANQLIGVALGVTLVAYTLGKSTRRRQNNTKVSSTVPGQSVNL